MDITITIEDTLFARLVSTYDRADPLTRFAKLGTIEDVKAELLNLLLGRIKSVEGQLAARTAIDAVSQDVDTKQSTVIIKGV